MTILDDRSTICYEPIRAATTRLPRRDGATAAARPPSLVLECGHRFHEACIRTALEHSNRCPFCRDARARALTPERRRPANQSSESSLAEWPSDGYEIRGTCVKCGDAVFRGQARELHSGARYEHARCPTADEAIVLRTLLADLHERA